jgi:hypothetical protein
MSHSQGMTDDWIEHEDITYSPLAGMMRREKK